MDEKEIRRELRKVRNKETEILLRYRYGKKINLEKLLNRYIPDSLEETLDAAFREAFKLIFSRGSAIIQKTFNEDKLRKTDASQIDFERQWFQDVLLTSVEGAGLGLVGIGIPDIAVFTGMLLRTVYQTAAGYGFDYDSKTEQMYILRLIEAALARGKQAEKLGEGLDELGHRIDAEGFSYYGSMNEQIEKTAKMLSDETLYLKFLQTVPVVGVAGGLSNPIYMNRVKNYADVKYRKRWLLAKQRQQEEFSHDRENND